MNDDAATALRDVITILMVGLVVLLAIALAHVNPVATNIPSAPSVGNVVVDVRWPDGIPLDVDLWVKGPRDVSPVGYSNRGGQFFSLVRDDLGTAGDRTAANYENAVSRGIEPGLYAVTVHAYGGHFDDFPVEVRGRVTLWDGSTTRELVSEEVVLDHMGQEVTVAVFELDEEGRVVPGTRSRRSVQLRGTEAEVDLGQEGWP